MLKRKAMLELEYWKAHKTKQALLVSGARQVGKTFLIREFARTHYGTLAEVNFLENRDAARAIGSASNTEELFSRLSIFLSDPLVPGDTLVFLDEVQECKEIVTAIKFLVDRFPEYDYVLSGSLLGVELQNIRSVPVGYLDSITMHPLDFEEYCWARSLNDSVFDSARQSFRERISIDEFLHEKMMSLFHEYLIIGGMPDAVMGYVSSKDIRVVRRIQGNIIERYREDISKYAPGKARIIKRIFDLIPSELSSQTKRFTVSSIEGDSHVSRYENDFGWLADAGVALPVYNVDEPRPPLLIAMQHNLFKLFLSDVGLLSCMCGMDVTREMLAGRTDVLFGAIYENVVAQELVAHGFPLYYFKNKSMGELDFLIECSPLNVVPVEVKSGKSYKRHSALSKAMGVENYHFDEAFVLCEGNVEAAGRITYAPIYCVAFLAQGSI